MGSALVQPVLQTQPGHPGEFPGVAGDQREIQRQRLGGVRSQVDIVQGRQPLVHVGKFLVDGLQFG